MSDGRDPLPHPLGSRARILLASVFGPFARDDEYGSRAINPMELWHNQVTRVQGPFSLRMFNRSWGLMLIQANVDAPCALLDFPTLDRFEAEIQGHPYDIVGISAIPPNVLKVEEMCRRVRRVLPNATIVVGGHVAGIPGLQERVGADHVVPGEGVRWFRAFLGEDVDRALRHPATSASIGTRTMGCPAGSLTIEPTATLIPSVGCPVGCNFCGTSAMFGGKGRSVVFYETGDELFDVMCRLEETMSVQSFFVMDENFLLYRRRSLRLLELMEEHDKAWSLHVFSSARTVRSYSVDQLVRLGLSWLWLGLEGEDTSYSKLQGVDTVQLVRELQSHGVRVLGSTIIGLEDHTPENIDRVIDHAVRHGADFHQFMLYSPSPGSPFFHLLRDQGLLKSEREFPWPDWHGQKAFSWRHPAIREGQESEYILRAFHRDLETNGPSVLRALRTVLNGWKRYREHPDARVRRRFLREARGLGKAGVAAAAGAAEYFRDDPTQLGRLSPLLEDLIEQFGEPARRLAGAAGPALARLIRDEEERLAAGWTYEPPTFYEVNAAFRQRFSGECPGAEPCRYVMPGGRTVPAG